MPSSSKETAGGLTIPGATAAATTAASPAQPAADGTAVAAGNATEEAADEDVNIGELGEGSNDFMSRITLETSESVFEIDDAEDWEQELL
jgi:hypothetical protein